MIIYRLLSNWELTNFICIWTIFLQMTKKKSSNWNPYQLIYTYNFILHFLVIHRITIYSFFYRIKLISLVFEKSKIKFRFFFFYSKTNERIAFYIFFDFISNHRISTCIVRISNLYPVYLTKRITRTCISVTEIVKSE